MRQIVANLIGRDVKCENKKHIEKPLPAAFLCALFLRYAKHTKRSICILAHLNPFVNRRDIQNIGIPHPFCTSIQRRKDSDMSKVNSSRNGCKDVFRAFLVADATYDGNLEIPRIEPENTLPTKLIPFSKAIRSSDFNAWIHFYEDDVAFERIWNGPLRYLPILKRFAGVITPDFSLYRDMPLVMQYWNVYRSRAIGHWLQANGIPVIVNVRFADERTYDLSCTGVPQNSTIAVGSHGCIKVKEERDFFQQGLAYIVEELKPQRIIVYGTAPISIFGRYQQAGIDIVQFDSDCTLAHRKAVSS